MSNSKYFEIDIARATACCMVIILHVSSLVLHESGGFFFTVNAFESTVRAAVPIFFMVSGALLLKSTDPLKIFLKKRLLKILPPLTFWTIFYALWLKYNHVPTSAIMSKILPGPMMYHLWYLYAVIGLYSFIPIIKYFYLSATKKEVLFYLIVWGATFSVFPYISILSKINIDIISVFHLHPFTGYLGYFVLGAFLYDHKKTIYRNNSVLTNFCVFIVATLLTGALTLFFTQRDGKPNEIFYHYNSPFVLLAAIGLFGFFINIKVTSNHKVLHYIISRIATNSLGIYCMHIFTMEMLSKIGISAKMGAPIWSIPLTSTLVLLFSDLIIGFLRKSRILAQFC